MLYSNKELEKLKKAISEKLWPAVEKIETDEDWTFNVIATTESTDRDWEVIKITGWDTSHWEKSPVILANHDYRIQSIIGKWLRFYEEDGKMRLEWVFSQSNPLGKLAKELYNEGMLKAVSVGFIPKKRSEEDRTIIEQAELLETSFVAVWSNRDAISLDGKLYDEAVAKGLIKEVESEISEQEEKDLTIEDLHADIQSIKELVQGLADDKAKAKEQEKEVREAQERKEILQEVNKATSKALENLKKL